jgi:uncharacterized OsmC-like protein
MSQAATTERGPINGVDVPTLFATIDAVDQNRELAKFQFRATNTWQDGTFSRTSIETFYGAGQENRHVREYVVEADHPQVLVGADRAPLPVELVLAGLASCLMGGVGSIASARGIKLHSVKATIEGDLNLLGVLGLDKSVRNGYQELRIDFEIDGDASPEDLAAIVNQSKARSAVYDIVTNQTPVQVTVNGA